jgi:hypothetical protein
MDVIVFPSNNYRFPEWDDLKQRPIGEITLFSLEMFVIIFIIIANLQEK